METVSHKLPLAASITNPSSGTERYTITLHIFSTKKNEGRLNVTDVDLLCDACAICFRCTWWQE
jgi:hypothetical protein